MYEIMITNEAAALVRAHCEEFNRDFTETANRAIRISLGQASGIPDEVSQGGEGPPQGIYPTRM
jgi:hypothetical protein